MSETAQPAPGTSGSTDSTGSTLSRRTFAKAAAWTAPVVALAVAAPAEASSLPPVPKPSFRITRAGDSSVSAGTALWGESDTIASPWQGIGNLAPGARFGSSVGAFPSRQARFTLKKSGTYSGTPAAADYFNYFDGISATAGSWSTVGVGDSAVSTVNFTVTVPATAAGNNVQLQVATKGITLKQHERVIGTWSIADNSNDVNEVGGTVGTFTISGSPFLALLPVGGQSTSAS